jgi:hypothetical protein
MSDREMKALYESILRGDGQTDKPIRQSMLYDMVNSKILEPASEEEPGKVGATAKGEDGIITLFWSDNKEILAKLEGIGAERVNMSKEYFDRNVKGRMDEDMSDNVTKLVKLAMDGEIDQVARRGLYDVFAKYHITGAATERLLKALQQDEHPDILEATVEGVDTYTVIDVISKLNDNIVSHGFTMPEGGGTMEQFLNDLWDVKDVKGRTSVGRGELAMSMMTIAYKGEPGDVRTKARQEEPAVTNHQLQFKDGLSIEVKGSGGRPGKGKLADLFVKKMVSLLKRDSGDNTDKKPYADLDDTQKVMVDNNMILRMKSTGEGAIREISEILQKKIKSINTDHENYVNIKDWADRHAGNLDTFLRDSTNFQNGDPAAISKVNAFLDEWFNTWNTEMSNEGYLRRIKPHTILQPWLSSKGNLLKTSSKIYKILHGQESIAGDEAAMMDSMDGKFQEAVRTFFMQLAYTPEGLLRSFHEGKTPGQSIAQLLWQTRADVRDNEIPADVSSAIEHYLTENPSSLKDNLGHFIGSIQLTAYCMDDKFTHGMFVADESLLKSSLVVRTPSDEPGVVFTNIYDAFTQYKVNVPLSIDAQNKGVQIVFSGVS